MKDRKISIRFTDWTGHQLKFESLRSLIDFLKSEINFWLRQRERVDPESTTIAFFQYHEYLNSAAMEIAGWSDEINNWSDETLNNELDRLKRTTLEYSPHNWLWSGHPYVEQFVLCHSKFGDLTAQAFLDYIAKRETSNIGYGQYFLGYILGYEYLSEESFLPKRRTTERISLNQIRDQYITAKDSLFREIEDIKSEITAWSEKQKRITQRRHSAQKRLNSRLHIDQQLVGENKLKKQDHDFDEKLRTWSGAISVLEQTYQEKLRLEGPATYWRNSAKRYGIQGGLWFLCIIALVTVGIINFQEIFTTWLQGKEIDIKLNTIQGVVLFGSVAAVYAYLLKVLSRLTFSSFHLMRDAEEREQLTYFYLSLRKDGAVDDNSRDIVLQALFSRTETGLLAQEHGPTMPGMDVIKSVSHKKD